MRDYLQLLRKVERWYRGIQKRHPDEVTCTRGCRECCLGLFDISLADAELLREGLAGVDESTRNDIRERAVRLMSRLRRKFPHLRKSMEGCSTEQIDRICAELGPVECPVLGKAGECRLYAHRPLTCRLMGVPVVDRSGEEIVSTGCSRCTLRACESPRIDYHSLRAEEERILARRYPGREAVTLLIPQAIESGREFRSR